MLQCALLMCQHAQPIDTSILGSAKSRKKEYKKVYTVLMKNNNNNIIIVLDMWEIYVGKSKYK